jgi:hypothetical protein
MMRDFFEAINEFPVTAMVLVLTVYLVGCFWLNIPKRVFITNRVEVPNGEAKKHP